MPLALCSKLGLTKYVEVIATNASKLYGLYPRKGAIIPGISDADLTIWYPGKLNLTVQNEMLHHDVDYSPYEGQAVSNWPRYTILRGKVVWDRDNGGIMGEKGYGSFIKRGPAVGIWETVAQQKFDLEEL
jgi:dihydropyrimidinase